MVEGQDSQAFEDATRLIDTVEDGLNADCVFQGWSRDRQMSAVRELNKIQDPTDHIPDLTLHISGRLHVAPAGGSSRDYCSEVVERERPQRRPDPQDVEQDRFWKDMNKMFEEHEPAVEARERERVENPEKPAERIQDLADQALDGDEQAKLDLRKRLESLMNDPNQEYRDAVLERLEDDGGLLSNPFDDKPYVKVERGENGEPESITFKEDPLGITEQTIPLDKSVSEQVDEAQRNYRRALGEIAGGRTKDPEAAMRAFEILHEGATPNNLRWFMIHRKDEGRHPVDQH